MGGGSDAAEAKTDGGEVMEEAPKEAYWDTISDEKLITGYLEPLAYHLEEEGSYVKSIAVRRAIERLRARAE